MGGIDVKKSPRSWLVQFRYILCLCGAEQLLCVSVFSLVKLSEISTFIKNTVGKVLGSIIISLIQMVAVTFQ